jgi:hypothetical protein
MVPFTKSRLFEGPETFLAPKWHERLPWRRKPRCWNLQHSAGMLKFTTFRQDVVNFKHTSGKEIVKSTLFCKVPYVPNSGIKTIKCLSRPGPGFSYGSGHFFDFYGTYVNVIFIYTFPSLRLHLKLCKSRLISWGKNTIIYTSIIFQYTLTGKNSLPIIENLFEQT